MEISQWPCSKEKDYPLQLHRPMRYRWVTNWQGHAYLYHSLAINFIHFHIHAYIQELYIYCTENIENVSQFMKNIQKIGGYTSLYKCYRSLHTGHSLFIRSMEWVNGGSNSPNTKEMRFLPRGCTFRLKLQRIHMIDGEHSGSNKPWQTKDGIECCQEGQDEEIKMVASTLLQ